MNKKTEKFQKSDKLSISYNSVHIAPYKQIGLHKQSTWELSYIIVGEGVRLIGDTSAPFSSGEVVLIPPEIPHCWYFNNKVTDTRGRIVNITLTFDIDFLEHCRTDFPELQAAVNEVEKIREAVKLENEKREAVVDLMVKMQDKSDAERLALAIQLLVLMSSDKGNESVVGEYQKLDKVKDRVHQIRTYVACNVIRNISLDDVANHVGMNRSSFCVFFKKAMNTTFINYLNEYRVELACKSLKNKELTVAEICYQVGFNDVPYFNRVFKRIKGVSPRKY